MEITKLNLESEDIVQNNIKQLKQLFPEIVTEGKIDFYKLKEVLGEEIDDGDEKYEFTWNGKHDAIREFQKPSHCTLRPDKKNSKNWNTTENLYIEGDNLEVLKLLQKSYQSKIKMMYIDPPYNTGNDSFIYKDNFQETETDYLEKEEERGKFQSNPNSSGRYHTNWMNMIYPLLRLARNLLSDEGVLLISIDDNEFSNLIVMCKEIFGEENIDPLIWQKVDNDSGKMKITYRVRLEHEYVLICYKNKNKTYFNKFIEERNYKNEYTNPDNDPRGQWISGVISNTEKSSNKNSKNYYDITTPSGKIITREWRVSKEEMDELIKDNRIYFGSDGNSAPRLKSFINEPKLSTPTTILSGVGTAKTAGKDIEDMLGSRKIFSYPKPKELIKHLINMVTDTNYSLNPNYPKSRKIFYPGVKMSNSKPEQNIILDFFSGSATTAEAVMDLNLQNNLNNKFIMIQYREKTDEKSEAYKQGYNTICEIGEERIRRAGDKLLDEHPDSNIDVGFKVLKLDTSNFKEWNPSDSPLEEYLEDSVINVKEDRNELDLIYEIMIKYGIELTSPIEEIKKSNYTFYSVGYGALIVCLDDKVEEDVTDEIIEIINENIEIIDTNNKHKNRVVFKDISFLNDSVKTNIIQVLENNNIEDFITY